MKQQLRVLLRNVTICILCIILSVAFSVAASAAEAADEPSIKVEAYNGNTAKRINTIFPWFKITNTGSTQIPLSDISARYYYTIDGFKAQSFWCDWCSKGDTSMVSGRFVTIPSNNNGIDTYFEIGFNNSSVILKPGESVEAHIRIAKEDWSDYNQENDYSFNGLAGTYVAQEKIVGLISNNPVWGNNPVNTSVTGVKLNKHELVMSVADTTILNATILPSNATNNNVIWSSSSPIVAEVDSNGLVTGKSIGVAIITVQTSDGSYTDSCKISVIDATIEGSLEGRIRDAVKHNAISDANISLYKETASGYEKVISTSSNSEGLYKVSLPVGEYKAVVTKDNYISAINYLKIQQGITTYSPELQIVSDEYAGAGAVSGVIKNAFTGAGVEGITINIRQGINSTKGPIVGTTVSNEGGKYSINLPGGNYTAELSGSNYITGYFDLISIGGRTTGNQDGVVSPVIMRGQTRIVLTWGEVPRDLDSHLTGTLPDSKLFHTFYYYKTASYNNVKYADLDLDDRSSFGPETTTIYKETDGIYTFYVHDFTNYRYTSSTALSNSGAQVKVYSGDVLLETFNVPVNQGGTLWKVFSMKDGVIVPLNEMSYANDAEKIGLPQEDIWLEGAHSVTAKLGESIQLPGSIETNSTIEKVTLTVTGTDGYFDTVEMSVGRPGYSLSRFTIDTNASMNPLNTYENPFSKPGNYTIRVWAKAVGLEAKMLGEIPVAVLPADEVTVTGILAPMLKTNNYDFEEPVAKPLEGFTIKIMDRSGNQDKLLTTAVTKADGSFSATLKNDLSTSENGYDIFLRLELNDVNAKIVKQIKDASGEVVDNKVHSWDSNIIDNVVNNKVDFGTLQPTNADGIEKGFFIWNTVKDARNFYMNNTTDHYQLQPVTIVWNKNVNDGLYITDTGIHIDDGLVYDYSSILHEYGHYIMAVHDAFPTQGDGDYGYVEPCDPHIAYSEGWAEFFSSVVYGEPLCYLFTYSNGDYYITNRETLEDGFNVDDMYLLPRYDGNREEYEKNSRIILRVCGTFWDLYDNNNDTGNDIVALPFSTLDSIMRTKCETFIEYYDRLYSLGYAKGQEEAIWRVIDDIGMAHDVTLPTIEMDWDIVSFEDYYLIHMTAEDDVAVKAVEWYLDNELVEALYEGGWENLQNYIYTITKGQLADGTHELKIVVMDCEAFWYIDSRRDEAYAEKLLNVEVKDGKVVRVY